MDSFQSELGRAFREGAARTRDDMDELEREEDAYVLANVDRIRRAALVEVIRGMGLVWRGRGSDSRARVFGDLEYELGLDLDDWFLFTKYGAADNKGTGGKAGALQDYRARVASMFEDQFPGITEEVCGE